MNSLHNLVTDGKILYLGISNTPAWVVTKANEYARQRGLTPFSVYEGQWSAAQREIERDILPMCNAEGMAMAPFGVLGMGYFLTAAQRKAKAASGAKEGRNVPFVDIPQKEIMADTLEKISNARGVGISSVALAWVRAKGPYIFPIIGGRKMEHMKSNIEALSLELTREEIEEIESVVPFDFGYPQTFLGGPGSATGPGDVWTTRRIGHFDWVAPPQVSQNFWTIAFTYADLKGSKATFLICRAKRNA